MNSPDPSSRSRPPTSVAAAYHLPVDPTTQAALAALAGAIVSAAAVLAWHISQRQLRHVEAAEEPVVPPGVGQLLSVLRSSAVVVNENDLVLKASAPAYALGLVRGNELANAELTEIIDTVRKDGQIRETEIVVKRGSLPSRNVTARVAPLGTRLMLALVEDRTRERREEEIRRDFVANVSHELKTPVGALRLLAEAVSDAADDPVAVKRFADRMLTEADRLSTMVQQIIELSRLQRSQGMGGGPPVAIDEVVALAVDTSRIDAETKKVALLTGGEPHLQVAGNRDQLVTAVSNLVANAVAYSSAGSTVSVETRSRDGNVEISVLDRGIGIPAVELDRIFERFYRVDPARRRSTGGTGLGLSIVQHVAATHNGEVRVWSAEGEGSTFTLILPELPQEVS